MPQRTQIAIIGGGASALFLACELAPHANVHIYEQNASLGKKYLVAGKGGFNISHAHTHMSEMAKKYTPAPLFTNLLENFTPTDLQNWYAQLGIATFIGSSNRIFPTKTHSPGDVLRAIKKRMQELGVQVHLKHTFMGFNANKQPLIKSATGTTTLNTNYTIFCLGGGSWSVTGANQKWLPEFKKIGVNVLPFQAANCGLTIAWPNSISAHHLGKPLKNICVKCGLSEQKGEAVITQYGLEGNAIYPISAAVREAFTNNGPSIQINLKPHNTPAQLISKIKHTSPEGLKKKLGLTAASWALFKHYSPKEAMASAESIIHHIQHLAIPVQGLRPIEEAISTVGGVDLSQVTPNLNLKHLPHTYVTGEMLNWDAPTGGYLLHGCFAMAHHISKNLINKINA